MENYKIIFYESTGKEKAISVSCNSFNEISIDGYSNGGLNYFISLDKPTAVRLVRELKRQIGNIKNETNE